MLEVDGLTKEYGSLVAVDDLSFRIEQGEFATLLGPSGCGKSTTLHCIAGLTEQTAGTVYLRGENVSEVPPNERNIGLVFQHSALFPHMTASENIRYGLRMQEWEGDHDAQVERFLDLVQLPDHGDHYPNELSGGQQRRLSLARALAYEPDILLLDEPLTGLDRVLREDMRNEIRKIQREVDVTTLQVTHDQAEALSMSDRVIVMNDGRKEQEGGPGDLYRRPATEFVADFVGKSTKFEGQQVEANSPTISVGDGAEIEVDPATDLAARNGRLSLYVRPEHIEVEADGAANGTNAFQATVEHVEYLGHRHELEATLEDGTTVIAYADSRTEVGVGERISVRFDPSDVIVL